MSLHAAEFKHEVLQSDAGTTTAGTTLEVTKGGQSGGYKTLMVQVEGIGTATVSFEGTIDGGTWYDVVMTNVSTGGTAVEATADGLWRGDATGLIDFRARVSAFTAGTIDVTAVLVA